jgi:hypothetical protein
VDFVAYALINLLSIVDVLDLASSRHYLHVAFVRQNPGPAAALLTAFKVFFTAVLLQPIFASLRQGKLLAETIADFWSPHEPIHARARAALPQYGDAAIGPLLASMRQVDALTKEQRKQLPVILAAIGPATIPTLVQHLVDPHEHVRAVAAAALGRLHARDSLPDLAPLAKDPSELVRLAVVEALGDPVAGVRLAALKVNDSLGERGAAFAGPLNEWDGREEEPELRQMLARLRERLAALAAAPPEPAAQEL